MNRLTFFLCLYLFLIPSCQAQTQLVLPTWASQYESVRPSEDVFIVLKNRKMGTVNQQGIPLAQVIYDTIFDFREGIAIVGQGHRAVNPFGKVLSDFKYGYLTKAGRLVVPMQYERIDDFSEGFGLINTTHQYIYFNKQGKPVLRIQQAYDSRPFKGNLAYEEVPGNGFWLAPYNDGRNNGNHSQLYDINGKTIYGNYIDRSGRLLIPRKYDTIAPYQPGYLRPVCKNGKWGFLDSLAQIAVPLQYDDIDTDSSFFWQNLRRVGQGNRFGFLNPQTGQLVVPIRFEATQPSQRPVLWVRQRNRWGLIDNQQQPIIQPRYEGVTPFDAQGLSIVQQDSFFGLVDTQGKVLIPLMYERILAFQEDRAVVGRNGKFGFITTDGYEMIPTVYDQVSPFSNGQAFAKRWGLFITLDKAGHWVGWKFQTSTLKWISAILAILIGTGWWIRRRGKRALVSFGD